MFNWVSVKQLILLTLLLGHWYEIMALYYVFDFLGQIFSVNIAIDFTM